MKRKNSTVFGILCLLFVSSCVTKRIENQYCIRSNCAEISNKNLILDSLAEFLNQTIDNRNTDYSTKNGNPIEFAVVNLQDSILSIYNPLCLTDNSIFAFGPVRKKYSYTSILIMHNGSMNIFKFVNCPNKGTSISEVKDFLLKNDFYRNFPALVNEHLDFIANNGLYDTTLYFDNYEANEVFSCGD